MMSALAIYLIAGSTTGAQGTRSDYVRAEQLLGWNAQELLLHDGVRPRWVGTDRFWYRDRGPKGYEFVMVDAATGTKRPVFDQVRLAASLSQAADTAYEPYKLPFRDFQLSADGKVVRFSVARRKFWSCDVTTYACTGPDTVPNEKPSEVKSPDGKWVALERGGNLYVRPAGGGEEVQLTTDGNADYGYGLANIGCCQQVTNVRSKAELRPYVLWSPDSRRLITHKWDQRGVRQMALLETKSPGPVLYQYRYALPGDSVIPKFDLYVFELSSRRGVRVDVPPQDVVNTSCCWLSTDTVWKDVRWGAPSGSDQLFFTSGKRGFHELTLYAADAASGKARSVLKESGPTFIETNQNSGGVPNWRPIAGGKEVVWWSERDGYGHLYLVDAATGAIKNRITSGDWMVSDLLWIDEALRYVYFTGRGREAGRDPYFRFLYRAKLDGSAVELLTPENGDHAISQSADGKYIVDVVSRPDTIPVSYVRLASGAVVKELQRADVSKLLAAGFTPPESFSVKARDGQTDLMGLLFKPSTLDPKRKYPIIDYIYPGPQVGSVGGRQFTVSYGGNARALAELGFFVMQVDAMGTPGRSKAFHDAYYGNMTDNGIPDQMAAIKQLASRYPQIDLDRVGIFGHSGGGFSSTDAILSYPDFFKVAVSSAGNHDNRGYDYTWGEKYQGLLKKLSDSTDSFDSQSNWRKARNLRGKLLLVYGTLDDNVHPNNTQLVIDELIKANKDFDMFIMPNRNHGFANDPYMVRRTWDYFVKNLLGVDPPAGYQIKGPPASP
ncbi:MAG: DPP IV N-terminal domain-containing protein [Gemmatimonadaceae bacterium]